MPAIGSIIPTLRKSGSSDITIPPVGWVGSSAGVKGDLVTINNTTGVVSQATGVNTTLTSSGNRVAMLGQNVPVGAGAGTLVQIDKLDEDSLIALQAADASGTALATVPAMVGRQCQIYRNPAGNYVVNVSTNLNSNAVVEVVAIDPRYNVGETGGTLLCRVLPGSRIN